MLHRFETTMMACPADDDGLPSKGSVEQQLAADDVSMLAFATVAAVVAAVLLALGF